MEPKELYESISAIHLIMTEKKGMAGTRAEFVNVVDHLAEAATDKSGYRATVRRWMLDHGYHPR